MYNVNVDFHGPQFKKFSLRPFLQSPSIGQVYLSINSSLNDSTQAWSTRGF